MPVRCPARALLEAYRVMCLRAVKATSTSVTRKVGSLVTEVLVGYAAVL
jgi:hypothetical protein